MIDFARRKRVLISGALALGAVVAWQSCRSRQFHNSNVKEDSTGQANAVPSRWLMDWASQGRKIWYLTPQGSFILPMDIFRALKTEDGARPFASRENLTRYGWIYAPEGDESHYSYYGLPLGFTEEPNPAMGKVPTMGISCAACHTGELLHEGTRYVIDGGQPMYDIGRYNKDMVAALSATFGQDGETERMRALAADIAKINPESPYVTGKRNLKSDFKASFEYLRGREERNKADVEFGNGRLDAVTQILNELAVHHIQSTETEIDSLGRKKFVNAEFPEAPISLPHLWSAPDLECVQTNCLARNPLTRNHGEVLGVYGQIKLRAVHRDGKADLTDLAGLAKVGQLFDIGADLRNLYCLEESLRHLPTPKWREDVFGSLDANLLKRGEELYFAKSYKVEGKDHSCASCHVLADRTKDESLTPPNSTGHRFFRSTRWKPEVVGTDPTFLEEHGTRVYKNMPAHLKIIYSVLAEKDDPIWERFNPLKDETSLKVLGLVNLLAVKKWFLLNGIKEEEQKAFSAFQEPSTDFAAGVYKARPLNGIAFSAPYLHNGSVPDLVEFFQRPEERRRRFDLGTIEWDPRRAGYKLEGAGNFSYGRFKFDANLRGNKNTGHAWGTELPEADKVALVEYLKGIPDASPIPENVDARVIGQCLERIKR